MFEGSCSLEYILKIQDWRVMNSCLKGFFDLWLISGWIQLTKQRCLHDKHQPLNQLPWASLVNGPGWHHQWRLGYNLSHPEVDVQDQPAESRPCLLLSCKGVWDDHLSLKTFLDEMSGVKRKELHLNSAARDNNKWYFLTCKTCVSLKPVAHVWQLDCHHLFQCLTAPLMSVA